MNPLKKALGYPTSLQTDTTTNAVVPDYYSSMRQELEKYRAATVYAQQVAGIDAVRPPTLDEFEDTDLVMEMISRGYVVMRAKDLEGKL